MNDWLIGFSEHQKTDDEIFQDYIYGLSSDELQKLAQNADPMSLPTQVDLMGLKISDAVRHGQELAHEQDDLFEKVAFLPALAAGAARLAGGSALKSIAGGVAKDMAVSAAGKKIMGALKPAAPAASAAGEVAGGFKYAGVLSSLGGNAGGLLQRAAAYTVKNPGTALTAAGAAGGALMAPRDPQTGKKQYLRGAVMGGGAVAGVNALSNGAVANKLRSSVMNRSSPLLGNRVRQYAMDASAAAKGKTRSGVTVNGAAQYQKSPVPAAASQAPVAPVAASPAQDTVPYRGGPTMGAVKIASMAYMSPAQQILYVAHLDAIEKRANRQTLTYDPSTKTFIRHHLTSEGPDVNNPALEMASRDVMGGPRPMMAGQKELVRNSATGMNHFGTREYVNSRINATEAKNPGWARPAIGPAANSTMAHVTPAPSSMAATRMGHIPGAAGGVAGIGAAAAKIPKPAATTGILARLGKAFGR